MKVKAKQSFCTDTRSYGLGEVFEVDDAQAVAWANAGLVQPIPAAETRSATLPPAETSTPAPAAPPAPQDPPAPPAPAPQDPPAPRGGRRRGGR